MSGGGGGGGGGIGPPDHGPIDCDKLIVNSAVDGPDPDVVAMLDVGSELSVQLVTDPPVVQLVTDGGDVLGAVLERWAELVDCLQQGKEFRARVVSIEGGNVKVRISPVKVNSAS
jgi:hypothetical protein